MRQWARLGALSFGGPPAQVALLRELTVEQRRWIDAASSRTPTRRPSSSPAPARPSSAIYCAHRLAGLAGAIAGGLAFILPGLLIILAISAVALSESPPTWVEGIGAGAAAAVVAVVVRVGIDFARASLAGRHGGSPRTDRALPARRSGRRDLSPVPASSSCCSPAGSSSLPGGAARARRCTLGPRRSSLLGATGAAALPALAWTAFKVGALSYGGGFVIIPLMQADAVDTYGWMTQGEFADAVAFGQLTPGPVVQTVAMVGWAAAGCQAPCSPRPSRSRRRSWSWR